MDPKQRAVREARAGREEQLADLEHDTEDRMHSVADLLPNPEAVHERANDISERARVEPTSYATSEPARINAAHIARLFSHNVSCQQARHVNATATRPDGGRCAHATVELWNACLGPYVGHARQAVRIWSMSKAWASRCVRTGGELRRDAYLSQP
jgi:hypothetical protein